MSSVKFGDRVKVGDQVRILTGARGGELEGEVIAIREDFYRQVQIRFANGCVSLWHDSDFCRAPRKIAAAAKRS